MKRAIYIITIVLLLFVFYYNNTLLNNEIDEIKAHEKIMTETIVSIEDELSINRDEVKRLKSENKRLSIYSKKLNDDLWESKQEIKKLKRRPKQTSRSKPIVKSNDKKGKLIGTFNASAYTDNKRSQGKWVGKTATGMKPQVGVIAVDPKVIPLGTKLYVEGYGNCIAGDTGGAIKGFKIDLFHNTQAECTKFGRKNLKVYRRD